MSRIPTSDPVSYICYCRGIECRVNIWPQEAPRMGAADLRQSEAAAVLSDWENNCTPAPCREGCRVEVKTPDGVFNHPPALPGDPPGGWVSGRARDRHDFLSLDYDRDAANRRSVVWLVCDQAGGCELNRWPTAGYTSLDTAKRETNAKYPNLTWEQDGEGVWVGRGSPDVYQVILIPITVSES